jgi:hypothetical protein
MRSRIQQLRSGTRIARRLSKGLGLLALVAMIWSCAEQPPPPLPPPPPPPPAPAGPPNYAKGLVGTWYASYPGGPLKATIVLDHYFRGTNYIATLVDGNKDMPPGTVAWRGTPDRNVRDLVVGEQLCAEAGHVRVTSVKVTMQVADIDHFTESLAPGASCRGFPVTWVRVKAQ